MELTAFETLEPREERYAAQIVAVMRAQLEKDYPAGGTLRDAHPRLSALVAATFSIEPDLPPELRVGLFGEPRRYEAWVRFSSASDKPRSDAVPDMRGAAIKVRGVSGTPIPESDEPSSQDFLLVNTPFMPLGTVKLFRNLIWLSGKWSPRLFVLYMLLTGRLRVLKALKAAQVTPTSPADIRYWSTTPYLFGPAQAAKYSLVPTSAYRSSMPATLTDHYLSENLQKHLDVAEASFDFLVQLRTDPATMPVEDAAVEWPEDRAPFVKVATLTIPRQQFRTPERAALAEALAFSPAHALAEHRPIGSVNRTRMRVYEAQADFRRRRDGRARAT
ncbi:MAG TPA: catalase family protein [Allosphingosinicella sp.]|jgi:hypothetical protein